MGNAALDTSLWEEESAEQALDSTEPLPIDELSAAGGLFWWGLASLAFWGLVALVVLSTL